jgi:hypothetical protein
VILSNKLLFLQKISAALIIAWATYWLFWGVSNYLDEAHDILYLEIDKTGSILESGVVTSEKYYSGICPKTFYTEDGKTFPMYICLRESEKSIMFQIPDGFIENNKFNKNLFGVKYKSDEARRKYLREGFEVAMRLPGIVALLASIAFFVSLMRNLRNSRR